MPKPVEVMSHWHHSVENFTTSSLEFYRSVETTLLSKEAPTRVERVDWKESGVLSARREYLRISHGRFFFDLCAAPFGKDFFFSWWLGRRGAENTLMYGCLGLLAFPITYAILAKVFGIILGFVLLIGSVFALLLFAANATENAGLFIEDVVLGLPLIGFFYARFIKPLTYFTEDSRLIFEESVHHVVIEHIQGLLAAHGAKALAPEQTKPKSRSILR